MGKKEGENCAKPVRKTVKEGRSPSWFHTPENWSPDFYFQLVSRCIL